MLKVGILGGGQLGRMLLQAAARYPVETHVLESDSNCPAASLCHHFTLGDIRNFEDVYAFGRSLDKLTIEIEQVNIEALEKLEEEGVTIIPKPRVLRLTKNKISQKEFYRLHHIPTAEFLITQNLSELNDRAYFLPAVHKIAEGGYDGKGVQILSTANDLTKGFDAPAVLEKVVPLKKELAVMVAINEKGEKAVYPLVEMCFDPALNLLDYQLCPAQIAENITARATEIALKVVTEFASPGLFAVEMFLDLEDQLLVNETAPRVHNSGHHSIEAIESSQFDMLWRLLLSLPLGDTSLKSPSIMINLVGTGVSGPAHYHGIEEAAVNADLYIHCYNKKMSKPGRKMGHITLLGQNIEGLQQQADQLKNKIAVTGSSER
ncbi:MAG: 5-(carboxyamino)imidazole ribonucleotide synthase [Sphingomonadales bacterium]